ncbi:MAG: hypothetical protein LBT86_09480 [Deltaproteobacteria bacterium]|nr:hypothetical protein [Deltaproteobacteria bacterium]
MGAPKPFGRALAWLELAVAATGIVDNRLASPPLTWAPRSGAQERGGPEFFDGNIEESKTIP